MYIVSPSYPEFGKVHSIFMHFARKRRRLVDEEDEKLESRFGKVAWLAAGLTKLST
jgi:hypothetical protein